MSLAGVGDALLRGLRGVPARHDCCDHPAEDERIRVTLLNGSTAAEAGDVGVPKVTATDAFFFRLPAGPTLLKSPRNSGETELFRSGERGLSPLINSAVCKVRSSRVGTPSRAACQRENKNTQHGRRGVLSMTSPPLSRASSCQPARDTGDAGRSGRSMRDALPFNAPNPQRLRGEQDEEG